MRIRLEGKAGADVYLAVAKFSRDLGVRACNYNTRNPYINQYYIE